METTRLTVTEKAPETVKTDLVVYCLKENTNKKQPPKCDPVLKKLVKNAFELGDFKAEASQALLTYPPAGSGKNKFLAKRILLLGLGSPDKIKEKNELLELCRELGGQIAGTASKIKAAGITLQVPAIESMEPEQISQSFAEGIFSGDYRFTKYKETKKKDTDYAGLKTIQFASGHSVKTVRKGAKNGQIFANAVCRARDMANEPGNGWTSKEFADYAKSLSKTYGFKFTCLEKKDLQKLGMGGLLGVNQGSAIPPRMVILEYRPDKKKETLLLVGKGITFDTGGISLKPPAGMEEMKYDMCGGAAVLSAMEAVGQIKPDLNVVAIVPATDNMSGSHAIRPGDIIKHYNKVTAEIVNTDAEGRMILADALSYGVETFKPDAVVDIATLTGAVIIGLGHHYTGLISNHDEFASQVTQAGNQAGEPIWRLPLTDEYKKQIKSEVADIKNTGGRPAGTITAAAYLSNFVGDTPWAHLDIAGTAWDFTKKSYIPKGPSGTGVRTFINLIRNWRKKSLK